MVYVIALRLSRETMTLPHSSAPGIPTAYMLPLPLESCPQDSVRIVTLTNMEMQKIEIFYLQTFVNRNISTLISRYDSDSASPSPRSQTLATVF
jgi:hypothetical protein